MTTTAIDKELMELERTFWDSMQTKDGRKAGSLTADSCIVVGATGVMEIDPAAMESMTKEGIWYLKDYTFESMHIRRIADNVAVVAYGVKEDVTVEGKPVSFQAFDSSVWVRQGGSWTCVLHTETPAGDPFGRDTK